ncbi:hypothetical protein D5S18_25980 [Nocardia panacis]|uniref:DUF3806 domain-containing protein n=1 Tax=Nocardia panacis TaxID=2340916 RepID=A0A3A4K0A5_9NOCA|nr:hypothetical protein [Nocardia panacis]RJO70663.1 hypothetical protein D5S18_25980 [Nocardia panacis]
MSDDQMGFDIDVEQTAWGKWVDPDRQAAQARKFMDYAGIDRIPSKVWEKDSAEVKRLNRIVEGLFPDIDTAVANLAMTDAFVCFAGECFVEFTGGRWVDAEWADLELSPWNFSPAVACDTFDEDEIVVWQVVKDMIESPARSDYDGMFSHFVRVLREYAEDHAEKRREDSEESDNRDRLKF